MDKQWQVFIDQFNNPNAPFARVNPNNALIVVEKYCFWWISKKNIYVLFDFRLREGLKRPLFKGLNRPASEKENMKILENVSLALRNLILQNS